MKKALFITVFITIFACISHKLYAQDNWFEVIEDEEVQQMHNYNHHLGLLLGALSNLSNGEISLSTGIDYTYRFNNSGAIIGVGGFIEGAFGKHTEAIFGGLLSVKPWEEVQFHIAPSIIYRDLHTKIIDEIHSTSKVKFLLRFGGNFSFHIENFSISPTINADIVGSKVGLVYGIGFGVGI
ncbi:MAG TPA: hypothetical protein PL149_04095 [Candidatus Kapabacteria bacterium]|jgi:hypothetical protein|nr:hypothetical protein [Candidatus Kapabacteria bacterium]